MCGDSVKFQADSPVTPEAAMIKLRHLTPDNETDQLRRSGLSDRLVAHQPPVTQYGDTISQTKNLIQPVRDINHPHAARLQ